MAFAKETVVESGSRGKDGSFAEKLERLFRDVHPPGRGPYNNPEVAKGIEDAGLGKISPSYVWALRSGKSPNPTLQHMEALARFFEVPTAYFLDDAIYEKISAELVLLSAMRDSGVRSVALRSSGLSPGSLEAIKTMIENARRFEGLPESEPVEPEE